MTDSEYSAHFALWAILKAPLLIGTDITRMSNETRSILMAEEVCSPSLEGISRRHVGGMSPGASLSSVGASARLCVC